MSTFIISIIILIGGYYFYGRYLERVFGVDPDRPTPAVLMTDGVDFIPLPWWKIFLIQFLNIAGLGPIFGAIAGAMWGPVAFLWIVLGSLLGGGVHDYFSGMLSLRNNGMSLGEIIGKYLGRNARFLMTIFTLMVLILVGAVFIAGPAKILSDLTGNTGSLGSVFTVQFWVFVILFYYILATLLPVDKIIGRLYPVFGTAGHQCTFICDRIRIDTDGFRSAVAVFCLVQSNHCGGDPVDDHGVSVERRKKYLDRIISFCLYDDGRGYLYFDCSGRIQPSVFLFHMVWNWNCYGDSCQIIL